MSESEAPRPEVSESWTPPRPEWSRVALRQDLLDLAEDMRAWAPRSRPWCGLIRPSWWPLWWRLGGGISILVGRGWKPVVLLWCVSYERGGGDDDLVVTAPGGGGVGGVRGCSGGTAPP